MAGLRVVPSNFSQCVVIMTFDASSNLTIPCIWYLTTGKNLKAVKY
ncbi:hypothetical protein MXB_1376 [Myxobolus squamalis]|nr:hypothetical protein MXB_1376 [Myxobolus squamalis]